MMLALASNNGKTLLIFIVVCVLVFLSVNGYATNMDDVAQPGLDPSEVRRLGERMYREGLLPGGTPLRGYVGGDVPVDSTMFSCANCHTRSGLGSVEGQVASPPVNGPTLFNPRYLYKDYVKNTISKNKGVTRHATPIRPAYTEETLANALRGGINPDGRVLLPIMPRYHLEDQDMRILTSYLRSLSAEHSPGVTATTLRFATIITEDVSAADRAAMMVILNSLVTINQQTREQRKHPQFAKMFRMLDNASFRYISITPWELKGPPDSWRKQLEEYYRKEPVFAILGGISGQSWQPMHDFCEENRIPCLLPLTDLPVISEKGWYTLYASKGYFQEGDAAARFLAGTKNLHQKKILQIVSPTPEGEALAAGFDSAWREAGEGAADTVRLLPSQKMGKDELKVLLRKHAPETILLWGGPDVTALLELLGNEEGSPEVFLSSRYLGKTMWNIPEQQRAKVYLTYPYRLPEDEKRFAGYADILQLGKLQHKDENRIASRTFSLVHVFLEGLRELRLDFYRDTLLDLIAMLPDQYLPDFERYSFGPGQRYAAKGCYIVQLGKGAAPQLIKKSDWVIF